MIAKKAILLTSSRSVQFIIPVFLLPYLIGKVGLNGFGNYLYWLGISTYCSNIIGLNIETYSIRKVSEKVNIENAIFNPILLKAIISFFFLVIWGGGALYFSNSYKDFILIVFSIYPLLTVVFLPSHYFVGCGDFYLQLTTSLIEKLSLVFFILVFIRDDKDVYLIPFSYFLSIMTSLLFCYISMAKYIDISKYDFKWSELNEYVNVSKYLILSKITQIHTGLSSFIIGNLFGFTFVTTFDVANKLINIAKIPLSVISQVVYSSIKYDKRSYFNLFYILFSVSTVIFCFINYFAYEILSYFYASPASELSVNVFSILSLVLFFIPSLMAFGSNFIARYGKPNLYGKFSLINNLIVLIVFILCFYIFGIDVIGFAWIILLAESLLSIFCFICFIYISKRMV